MKEDLLEILTLGAGSGTTAILSGEPSTAFAVMINNKCPLLIDLGFGVTRSILTFLKEIPEYIYITHNHLDHAGELPVVSQLVYKSGRKLKIWSAAEVTFRLKSFRMAEINTSGLDIEQIIEWKTLNDTIYNDITPDIRIKISKSQHSEPCYGLILEYKHQVVFAYSADSGYNEAYYKWLSEAPVIILDGRLAASSDHAGFNQIEDFMRKHPEKHIYVVHYGQLKDKPYHLNALKSGDRIKLSW
ncbi:MAG: MBL fold metallo-hydrolase [Saprospiraceae bacterium]|nr:MBL fold metallo-hydrolase [Saprospiraceae bacterium]